MPCATPSTPAFDCLENEYPLLLILIDEPCEVVKDEAGPTARPMIG